MLAVKNYLAITNRGFRILWTFIFPLLAVGLTLGCSLLVGRYAADRVLLLSSNLLILLEVFSDYFGFGGICRKDALGMEYLHTAYGGDKLLKDALMIDMYVRVIRTIVYSFISNLVCLYLGMNYLWVIFTGLLVTFFSVAALNIGRYLDMVQYYSIMCVFICLLASGAIKLVVKLSWLNLGVICLAEIILLVLAFVLTYMHMSRRIKASYHDAS